MRWLRDFEKKAFLLIGVGGWWTLSWLGFTWIFIKLFEVPSNYLVLNILGLSAIVGFLFFEVWAILTLSIGFFKEMFLFERNGVKDD